MVVEEKDLLAFAIGRTNEINTYWNILIALATATLGTMATAKSFTSSTSVKIILSVGFLLAAGTNLDAINSVNWQRTALLDLIRDPNLARIVAELRPYPTALYMAFHIVIDILVVVAIWVVEWPSRQEGPTAPA